MKIYQLNMLSNAIRISSQKGQKENAVLIGASNLCKGESKNENFGICHCNLGFLPVPNSEDTNKWLLKQKQFLTPFSRDRFHILQSLGAKEQLSQSVKPDKSGPKRAI